MRLMNLALLLTIISLPALGTESTHATKDDVFLDYAEDGNLGELRKMDHNLDVTTLSEALRIASAKGYKSITAYLLNTHKFSQFTRNHALDAAIKHGQKSTQKLLLKFGAELPISQEFSQALAPRFVFTPGSREDREWSGQVALIGSVAVIGVVIFANLWNILRTPAVIPAAPPGPIPGLGIVIFAVPAPAPVAAAAPGFPIPHAGG